MMNSIHTFQDKSAVKRISEYLFDIALIIEIAIVLLDKSAFLNPIEGRLFQVTFILFFFKMVLTRYEFKEYIALFLFCIFGVLVDYFGERNEIMRFVVFVAACKGIDIKKAMKMVFWIQGIGCLLIATLSIIGLYGPLTVEKEYQGEGFFTRYCFGMGNANSFHTMFFVTVLLGVYLYNESIKWWGYVLIAIADMGLFILTDCRTATALAFGVVIIFGLIPIIVSHKERILMIASRICILVNIALILLSVYFAAGARRYNKYYWDSFWENPPNPPHVLIFFDKLLTGRILSLTEYDFHGSIESWGWFTLPNNTVYFDLGWVRLFYWYGIIPAVVIIAVFAMVIVFAHRRKMYLEVAFLTVLSIYTFVEAHFVSVYIGRAYQLFILGMLLPMMLADKLGGKQRIEQ